MLFCFPPSLVGLRLKLWHHASYVEYLVMYPSACGREGEGKLRSTAGRRGDWRLQKVKGEVCLCLRSNQICLGIQLRTDQ